MKVALLIAQSRVSPVFETTATWLQIEVTARQCLVAGTHHFKKENENAMVNELLTAGIAMIICGAIPYYLEKTLINQGCEVCAFTAGEIDQVIEALQLNLLDRPKFRMPGCQKRKQRGNNPFCGRAANP